MSRNIDRICSRANRRIFSGCRRISDQPPAQPDDAERCSSSSGRREAPSDRIFQRESPSSGTLHERGRAPTRAYTYSHANPALYVDLESGNWRGSGSFPRRRYDSIRFKKAGRIESPVDRGRRRPRANYEPLLNFSATVAQRKRGNYAHPIPRSDYHRNTRYNRA